jgi:heme oxygenase-like protein
MATPSAASIMTGVDLDVLLERLLDSDDVTRELDRLDLSQDLLLAGAMALARRAFEQNDYEARRILHRALSTLYEPHLGGPRCRSIKYQFEPGLTAIRLCLEGAWEEWETARVSPNLIAAAPAGPQAFRDWFIGLGEIHRRETRAFFDFLAEEASTAQMRYFFLQEGAVDTRFDDVIALTQVGLSGAPKMELAENFWDELGNGDPAAVHTTMFNQSLASLGWTGGIPYETLSWQSLANANLLLYFALVRRHCLRSVGCLGVLELTSPYRFQRMVDGCRRLGILDESIAYQKAHIGIDTEHGEGWVQNGVVPLVSEFENASREIALGALMRINVAVDYYQGVFEACRRM